MKTPLRILPLDEREPDRELVHRALVGEKVACEFVYAAGKAEPAIVGPRLIPLAPPAHAPADKDRRAVGRDDQVSKPVRLGALQAALERWPASPTPVA